MLKDKIESTNLVAYLEQAAPQGIEALRRRYPSSPDLLSSAKTLGEAPQPNANQQNVFGDRDAVVSLIIEGAQSMAPKIGEVAQALREKIRTVSYIKFSGAILATVAGGLSAIFGYFHVTEAAVAAVTALFGMVGGIAALFADQLERAPSGIRIASVDEYAKLIAMRADIERILAQVKRDRIVPIDSNSLGQFLTQIDQMAVDLVRLAMA